MFSDKAEIIEYGFFLVPIEDFVLHQAVVGAGWRTVGADSLDVLHLTLHLCPESGTIAFSNWSKFRFNYFAAGLAFGQGAAVYIAGWQCFLKALISFSQGRCFSG